MDSVGAIDGTAIYACIPTDKQVPYRGRGKGECFQNVMALCDFDMIFRYIVVGWKGTAHDSRVLTETIRNLRNNFPIPQYVIIHYFTNLFIIIYNIIFY